MNSKKNKTITANKIEIKDINNKTRIILDASGPLGYATVTLFANNGVTLALSVNPDSSAGLSVFRADGTGAAGLGIKTNGESGLSLHDSVGRMTTLILAPAIPQSKVSGLKKSVKK